MKEVKEYIATVKDDGRLDVPKTMIDGLDPNPVEYVRVERKRASMFIWASGKHSLLALPVTADGRFRLRRFRVEQIQLYPGDRARITFKDGALRILKTVRHG